MHQTHSSCSNCQLCDCHCSLGEKAEPRHKGAAPAAAAAAAVACPQMDVVYDGALVLSESQVQTLLGYQNPINKFVNWNVTRAKVGHTGWQQYSQSYGFCYCYGYGFCYYHGTGTGTNILLPRLLVGFALVIDNGRWPSVPISAGSATLAVSELVYV
jgi:hypothetical protein